MREINVGEFRILDINSNNVFDANDQIFPTENSSKAFYSKSTHYISEEVSEQRFDLYSQDQLTAEHARQKLAHWQSNIYSRWGGKRLTEIGQLSMMETAEIAATYGDLKALQRALFGAKLFTMKMNDIWGDPSDDALLMEIGIENCLIEQEKAAELAYKSNDVNALIDAVENLRMAHWQLQLDFDENYYASLIREVKDFRISAMKWVFGGARRGILKGSIIDRMTKPMESWTQSMVTRVDVNSLLRAFADICPYYQAYPTDKGELIDGLKENAKKLGLSPSPQFISSLQSLLEKECTQP